MALFQGLKQINKQTNHQPRIVYPGKICFRNKKEIKTFPDEGKQKEYVVNIPILKEWQKDIL